MSQLWALKQGRVYTIYSQPIADVDDPPGNFLVQTHTGINDEQQIRNAYPGIKIVQKQRPVVPVVGQADNAAIQAVLAEHNVTAEDQAKILAGGRVGVPTTMPDEFKDIRHAPTVATQPIHQPEAYKTSHTEIGKMYAENDIQEKAMQEFKLLLAKYFANTKDAGSKAAVTTVGSFMLRLWPDLRDRLDAAKKSFEEPEFTL